MSALRVGIHLPQYGRAAGPEGIRRAAQHAEALGFADVWVSDHVVHPAAQDYPSAYLFDALGTLTWAAAATNRIGLGTSVLVLPQHNTLYMAHALASLDVLSGGRLIVGVGSGWSKGEFDALGMSFEDRGARLDEAIDVLRTCWSDDPATVAGVYHRFEELRVLPQPTRAIPIWVGGSAEVAMRRGVRRGDGYQLIGLTPQQAADKVARLRADRPESSFTISLRTGWDPQGMDPDQIRAEVAAFEQAGVQHVVAAPWRNDLDSWLRSMDLLAAIMEET